jgi:toxin YoeB
MSVYKIIITDKAHKGIDKHLRAGNLRLVDKIDTLLGELSLHPRKGTGLPERLRHIKKEERWSRRIDHRHRLLYKIEEDKLVVVAISTYGHYDDK